MNPFPEFKVTLTEAAAKELKRIMATMSGEHHLRAEVTGNGAIGYQSRLDLVTDYDPEKDAEFVFYGVRVAVDYKSLFYLDGSTIDWKNEGTKSGFAIRNPNAKKSSEDSDS